MGEAPEAEAAVLGEAETPPSAGGGAFCWVGEGSQCRGAGGRQLSGARLPFSGGLCSQVMGTSDVSRGLRDPPHGDG